MNSPGHEHLAEEVDWKRNETVLARHLYLGPP